MEKRVGKRAKQVMAERERSAGKGIFLAVYSCCVLAAWTWVGCHPPVLVYLDPGIGSYVFQIVLAACLATLASTRLMWGRWSAFLKRGPRRRKSDGNSDATISTPPKFVP
jgi:hypothetical protein